jgi:hypothetical protein
MRDFKFSKETSTIALVFFFIYFTYGIFRLPFVQYLVSMAVGAITYGICESYEVAVVALLMMNLIFPMIAGPSGPKGPPVQGFVSKTKEGFMSTNPSEISARVGRMKNTGIRGVGSPMSEGFEDAATNDLTLSEEKEDSENTEEVTATSKPAEASVSASASASESFKDNSGLFKLGEIPTETKGGFHIDAGTTVMNALKALKPDQIDAMTKDTKQLIETQKSLMNMLQTFTPMVKEGKQMMETFGSMFNPAGGAAMGSLQASQGVMNVA